MASLMPQAAMQGKYKRLLPPAPKHVETPSPCCHMYHSVGGCTDEHARPQEQEHGKPEAR